MDGDTTIRLFPKQNATAARAEYPGHDFFGLRDIYRALRRRGRIVGGVLAATVLLGAIYGFTRPPIYQATALLLMRPNEPQADVEAEQPRQPDNGYVQSQVEILRSNGLVRQLVDRLRLADDPQWGRGANRHDQAVHNVGNAIAVNRRDGTYVVEVSARSRKPHQAANMANDLVNVYFNSREVARIEAASHASNWLGERLASLRNEVKQREDEVEAYRAAHGLLTVDGTMIAEQQVRDAETAVLAAQGDVAERRARYNQVRSMANGGRSADSMAGALSSETMSELRGRQADVARRLADYNQRYGDNHPSVLSARAEMQDINRQIQAEVGRIAQNLDDETRIASARAASMQGHLNSVRGALTGGNADQVHLRELERNAAAARSVYENFLLRYQVAVDGAGGLGGDAQIISNATTPSEPVSRPALTIIAIAAALGLVAGVLAALLVEQFTTTLQSADDVEQKLGVPILTSVPQLQRRKLRELPAAERHPAGFLVARPMSAYAESMRMLRARIAHAGQDGLKVVAITSALAGEGKSSIALSLARVAALSGRKAMLIDCDLRRRSLNYLLGIEPRDGIAQVLRGLVPWRNATGRDERSGAHILPAASEEFSAEGLFDTAAMRELTGELSRAHDLVLLDCAPVLTLAEVRDLAALADGVIVVARRNATEVLALNTAIHELNAVKATILGIAFNGVDVRSPGRLSYADPLYFSHAEKDLYLTG